MRKCILDFLLVIIIRFVNSCARTTPATPVPVCATCSLGNIQLTPSSGAGTVSVTNSGVTQGPDGCNTLTVTCDAGAGNIAFMQFNGNQGGPDMATGQIVNAQLTCNDNGQWIYTGANGQSRVITEVNCVATT
ncbi:C6 domain-containing protein [Aphelenchoides besseyi]|nr:C6 domain-containing protein [Aphelenchoides besseyi]KAI6193594.1 C6 domain-containing protein [Aphelenchoides besseyi]